MRQLKRNFTVVDGSRGGKPLEEDVPMSPEDGTPARAVPRLPLSGDSKENIMELPLQPPPWKQTRLEVTSGLTAASQPSKAPRSPQRMLTPRVSWSDIRGLSQETLDDSAPRSPRTPVFRIRTPASPPSRSEWRRRPYEEESEAGRDKNEGRLKQEFCDVQAIGKGQFSTVYKARNRVDQCLYAVKKTTQIARGLRQTQLKEVFALANVSMEAAGCPHIVRYYSSWLEDGRLHIQTELCECSLRDSLLQRQKEEPRDPRFKEQEVVEVLRHVAAGLKVLHGLGFVHLDIKPDNILRARGEKGIYKIADLGLAAAAMGTGCDDISEGDCRYLAKEVLRGHLSDLPKADVFSLGLVIYELCTNPKALPCNGPEWQQLREGNLEVELLPAMAAPLVALLKSMVLFQPEKRPTCEAILQHPSVDPTDAAQAALEEENRRCRAEAARNRQLADEYWHEMMQMKRQELLSGIPPSVASSIPGVATPYGTRPTPVPPLRRGKTS
eukprot:TRINITY_DN36465_c0_g1_i1.p1 TRINITY_DN36465_c0_g1~~TRINITY_DN36465_c0_g1_i1.p1  ORF type:complete len:497 (+),score=127.35 TRINITY_DN36465_c0_g1_i1:61-1551(+)